MAYRDDVIALSARHDALAGEVAQKTRELEESRRLLEQARARARLPVLDQIRVASPCTADWNQMTGDDRTRHCGECRKNVYNLSDMTREEAEALLIERNGDLCVRYYQRHDGTILLADCTVGVQRTRRRRKTVARAAALVAGGLAAAGAMGSRVTMGKMASHDEPPCYTQGQTASLTMGKMEGYVPQEPAEPPVDPDGQAQQAPDDTDAPVPPSMQLPPQVVPAPHRPHRVEQPRPLMGAVKLNLDALPVELRPARHRP